MACAEGLEAIAEKLLEAGANPNIQTWTEESPGKQTPLHLAIANRHSQVVKQILSHRGMVMILVAVLY